MTVKTIAHPDGVRTFHLGRRRPAERPRLKLRDYLRGEAALPPAPSCDYGPAAGSVLDEVLCNDRLGCCTASGAFHVDGVLLGNAGTPTSWSDDQVIAFYERFGYAPGDPSTDQGADERDVLNSWAKLGLLADGSHAIAGWLSVDGTNVDECRQAVYLFENLYFGAELPDAWVNPMPSGSGFTWDVAGDADPENGHCFVGYGSQDGGILIDTWGMRGLITDAAVAQYAAGNLAGELYAVASKDALNRATQRAPGGLDWAALVADFDAMGGDADGA